MNSGLNIEKNKIINNSKYSQIELSYNPVKSIEKVIPIIKLGKDIYIYRTLYLIANESLFKDKNRKNIKFYLKSQTKPKTVFYIEKPNEKDILIESIRELIELILSLCSLTNTSNYKISIFSSYFENLQNNADLLQYQGKVLYAKVNELKINENIEENQIFRTYGKVKKNINLKKINNLTTKNIEKNKFPSLPQEKLGITVTSDNNKKSNETNSVKLSLKNQNISRNKIKEEYDYNNIYINENYININNYNLKSAEYENTFHKQRYFPLNLSINSQKEKFMTMKSNYSLNKPHLVETKLKKSNSDFTGNSTTTYRFPPKKLKIFFNEVNRNHSEELVKNNSILFLNDRNKDGNIRTRNKMIIKRKKLESFRLTSFTKEKSSFFDNQTMDIEKLNKLFCVNNKLLKENFLLDIARSKQRKIQSLKRIRNYLNKPSIIKPLNENFNSFHIQKLDTLKISYFSFKKKLYELSNNLNEYISDAIIEKFIPNIDESFKSLGFNLVYCLKEYFLYTYFDKCLNDAYPEIKSKNIFYDKNIKPEFIKDILKYLMNLLENLREKNKYDLVDYIRNIKNIKNCELTSDFFIIFIFCPNYFQLAKREITKKFLLVLEIDCVKNKVSLANFINYYHIFRYGQLVTTEQRIFFINKLLHLTEVKGDVLQNKIISDIEYLFKIDKRTKLALLKKVYDLKLNFHQTLKVNEIFESIVNYFDIYERKIN